MALLLGAAIAPAIALAAPAIAGAQTGDAPSQAGSSTGDDGQLQEIVVTATRRSANLQTVPVTLTALPAAALKTLNITSVRDLSSAVPGLQVAATGGNNLWIRGVGNASSGYNEAQVAVYVDGLYLSNPAMSIFSFNNIEQIEVLKGPQGTLYGRNATAGLISVRTRDPGREFSLDASLGYDSYRTRTEMLYVSGPLTSNLAANLAVYDTKQSKGWIKNAFTGNDAQKNRETGVQAKLLWDAGIGTRVTGNFIFDTNNRTYGLTYQMLPGTLGSDGTPFLGRKYFLFRVDPKAPFKSYIGSIKIEQDLGFAKLMSLTGYQKSDQHLVNPAGNNPILGQPSPLPSASVFDFNQSNRTWSQELQLTSGSSSLLEWVAGLYYYNDKTVIAATTYTTCGVGCANGTAPNRITGRPTTQSYSGYVDAGYKFASGTKFTVGLRYTDETKKLSGVQVNLPGFPNSVPGPVITPSGIPTRLHFGKLTYRLVLSQDFGSNIHAYIANNYGFKSGAYNANNFSNPPVRPEILNSYEAGIKTELFDRRVRLNLAYFYYDYKDVQVRSTAPPAPPGRSILQNIGKERIQGLNGDFTVRATDALTFNGGFEILDSKYIKFPGQTCSTPGPNRVVGGVTVGSVISRPCDLAGYDVAYVPKASATFGFTYNLDTDHGRFALTMNDSYSSPFSLTADGNVRSPDRHLINASLMWISPDKRYDVKLYVQNLANEYTYSFASPSANAIAIIPGAPRTFGATVGFHY